MAADSRSVYLVGFMRSGKTTLGRRVAAELGWPFVDLDDQVAACAGRAIADLFQRDGEAAFRRIEGEVLARVAGTWGVIATGGGTFASAANQEIMLRTGFVIWLRSPFGVIWNRATDDTSVMRPLWSDRASLQALYEARGRAYARAHAVLDVASINPEAATRILSALVRDWDGQR